MSGAAAGSAQLWEPPGPSQQLQQLQQVCACLWGPWAGGGPALPCSPPCPQGPHPTLLLPSRTQVWGWGRAGPASSAVQDFQEEHSSKTQLWDNYSAFCTGLRVRTASALVPGEKKENSVYNKIQYITNQVLFGRTGMGLVLKGQACKMLGCFFELGHRGGIPGSSEFPRCLAPNNLKDWVCCIVLLIAQLSFVWNEPIFSANIF